MDYFGRAASTQDESEKAEAIDKFKTEVAAKQVDNKKAKLTSEEIIDILEMFFNNVPNDISDQTQEVTTKNRGYNVKLSEILNGVDIDQSTTEYEVSFVLNLKHTSDAESIEVWSR